MEKILIYIAPYVGQIVLFFIILILTMLGAIVRNVWDDNVHLSKSKLITGCLLIALLSYAGISVIDINFKMLIAPNLFAGFKCKDIMTGYIKNKGEK